jgi:hypothetical protein
LLHGGEATFRLTEGVVATPWWRVLQAIADESVTPGREVC